MYYLSKDFVFEAGHRLVKGYEGKCNHPHGHSWGLTVEIAGFRLNKHGMVMDFKELKEIVKPIVDKYDHSFLYYYRDKKMKDFLEDNNFRSVSFKENPTSEHLAKVIAMTIGRSLPAGIRVNAVTIDETCTSSCTYKPFENEEV